MQPRWTFLTPPRSTTQTPRQSPTEVTSQSPDESPIEAPPETVRNAPPSFYGDIVELSPTLAVGMTWSIHRGALTGPLSQPASSLTEDSRRDTRMGAASQPRPARSRLPRRCLTYRPCCARRANGDEPHLPSASVGGRLEAGRASAILCSANMVGTRAASAGATAASGAIPGQQKQVACSA